MMTELNKQQLSAATTDARDVLVLAGAGTGKTRTIIARAIHLIDQGVRAERLALLTFTRRAAEEMKTRIFTPSLWIRVGLFAGTFHRFCLKHMNKLPSAFGIDRYTILDTEDQRELVKAVRLRVAGDDSDLAKPSELLRMFSYARNLGMEPADYLQQHQANLDIDRGDLEQILEIYDAYSEAKLKSRAMDFDDILFRFENCLRLNKELQNKIKHKYDHILVDEMQDTNPIQWSILEHLRDPAHLFCVGDDAQSIYAFRGADFRNVHSFGDRIPGAEIIQLQNNYRSHQEILDLANWLLRESPLPYDKDLWAERGQGRLPRLMDFRTPLSEAHWIVGELVRHQQKGLSWSDCAILTRSTRASYPIQAALKKNEIPFVFIGGLSLFERTHIKNLFSALKIIVNHKDELAWFRFLKLWPNIGDKTAMTFYKEVSRCSSWKEVGKLLRSLMGHFPAMVMGLEKMKKYEHNVHQTVKTAIEMLEEIMHKELEEDPEKRDDWDVLLSMAEYEPNLGDFIGTCSIDPEYDLKAEAQREGCLRLMTVHSAKGTEAKVCFLIAVDPHSYPHRKSQDAEEERRILYVAMTRAMDELILTRSGSPFGSDPFMEGNHVPCGDYLLNELPHILIGYQSIN